jgi:hypothetical protein|tara:strand:- start:69 stop:323 length:255 start_codon:yes stop_codon:yes gene_type:complete
MRRKIVRSKRPAPVGHNMRLCVAFVVTMLCAAGLTYSVLTGVELFNEYQEIWDVQNDCIAHMVSLGIERSEIIRVGDTCVVGEG